MRVKQTSRRINDKAWNIAFTIFGLAMAASVELYRAGFRIGLFVPPICMTVVMSIFYLRNPVGFHFWVVDEIAVVYAIGGLILFPIAMSVLGFTQVVRAICAIVLAFALLFPFIRCVRKRNKSWSFGD